MAQMQFRKTLKKVYNFIITQVNRFEYSIGEPCEPIQFGFHSSL